MSLSLGLAIYFIIWWLVLFAVLPFGVETQDEAGEQVPGTPASAPGKPRLLRAALITTVVAGALFGLVYWAITRNLFRLLDLPILGG
jgi:predicted secreted protein